MFREVALGSQDEAEFAELPVATRKLATELEGLELPRINAWSRT